MPGKPMDDLPELSHADTWPEMDGDYDEDYVLSIPRSQFHPNERLADREVGYELGEMVDERDIVSATDHIADIVCENQTDEPFPGGIVTNINIYYGTGVRYESHKVQVEPEIPEIDSHAKSQVDIPIGPAEASPLCVVDFEIEAVDGNDVVVIPAEEGPTRNGMTLKAPVIDRTLLRILNELMKLNDGMRG